MYKTLIALSVAVLAAGPVAASDKTDVMAVIHQWVDGFNKGDTKESLATCADQTSILDEFAPYEWHGSGACANWANEFDAWAKKSDVTPGMVTLGKPRHVDIVADHAYVVVPANFAFKTKGKPGKETGATVTMTLQKAAAAWHITGWSWARP